jgi:hypothetical protein
MDGCVGLLLGFTVFIAILVAGGVYLLAIWAIWKVFRAFY